MSAKYSCFLISPIGDSGTDTRINADIVRDLIVKPTLERYGFEVIRGDHNSEAGQIDVDVVRAVQESDLCIADVSEPNINVFYELGRRDETGKPVILIKSRDSEKLPVDIATRRYIEYDLKDLAHGVIDAMTQLRNFVEPIVNNGFESSGSGTSLSELGEIMKRIERKIDRISTSSSKIGGTTSTLTSTHTPPTSDNARMQFRAALLQGNIPGMEEAMGILQYQMDKTKFLDVIVESAAAKGSTMAGNMLIENAQWFMDNTSLKYHQKYEYLGCIVSYLNKVDQEEEYRELVENIANSLIAVSEGESDEDRAGPYNQLNRLYYGIYANTGNVEWLDKAIDALQIAKNIHPARHIYYNLAGCYRGRKNDGDLELALESIMKCLEMDDKDEQPDADHYETACSILYELDDPRLNEYLNKLGELDSNAAYVFRLTHHIG